MKNLCAVIAGLTVGSCAFSPSPLLAQSIPVFLAPTVITSLSGLTASVSPTTGQYMITAAPQGWGFEGTVGSALLSIEVSLGTDAVGTWHQVSFNHSTTRSSSIR